MRYYPVRGAGLRVYHIKNGIDQMVLNFEAIHMHIRNQEQMHIFIC
jgi:hypothetical protein